MHDLGDTIPLDFRVTNTQQTLVDADVVLTVTQPNGVDVQPTVAHAGLGSYTAMFVPTQAGRHIVRWAATGGATTAHADILNVAPAASLALVSLAEAREHLNIPDDEQIEDEELRGFIAAATGVVERHLGQVVARRQITENHDVRSVRHLALRRVPVLSVTSVETTDAALTWDADLFTVDSATGLLDSGLGPMFSGSLAVTYEAGWVEVPPHVILAAQIIIGHLWQTQRVQSAGPVPRFAGEGMPTPSGAGYAIPNRAAELLGGRPPVIA